MDKNKTIRMKDIADRAGVSTVTVSKALSGQRGVSEQVRAAILALAEEMQYQQTVQRQPRMKQSCSVGAIVAGHFMGGDYVLSDGYYGGYVLTNYPDPRRSEDS